MENRKIWMVETRLLAEGLRLWQAGRFASAEPDDKEVGDVINGLVARYIEQFFPDEILGRCQYGHAICNVDTVERAIRGVFSVLRAMTKRPCAAGLRILFLEETAAC